MQYIFLSTYTDRAVNIMKMTFFNGRKPSILKANNCVNVIILDLPFLLSIMSAYNKDRQGSKKESAAKKKHLSRGQTQ